MLISDKIKSKAVTRDQKGHYMMIKWSIHQENITIVNMYTPTIKAPKGINQILTELKEEINIQ